MNNLSRNPKSSITPVKSIGFAVASLTLALMATSPAQASTFTRGSLPSGVSEVGGIVLDLTGTNGTRVVTQAAANTLYTGTFSPVNPITIGTQTGFSPSVIAALGGGISQASVRVSLFDGDSAAGDFDFNENFLLLNGINFGNFSAVQTQNTDGTGAVGSAGSSVGFRNNTLDTGFFTSNNSTTLASLFGSLSSGNVVFGLNDLSPGDQFYDFTQGLSASVINIGTGPVITPGATAVPEPFTIVGTLIGATVAFRTRQRLKATNKL